MTADSEFKPSRPNLVLESPMSDANGSNDNKSNSNKGGSKPGRAADGQSLIDQNAEPSIAQSDSVHQRLPTLATSNVVSETKVSASSGTTKESKVSTKASPQTASPTIPQATPINITTNKFAIFTPLTGPNDSFAMSKKNPKSRQLTPLE